MHRPGPKLGTYLPIQDVVPIWKYITIHQNLSTFLVASDLQYSDKEAQCDGHEKGIDFVFVISRRVNCQVSVLLLLLLSILQTQKIFILKL